MGGLVLVVLTTTPQGIPHHLSSSSCTFVFDLYDIKIAPLAVFFSNRVLILKLEFIHTGLI